MFDKTTVRGLLAVVLLFSVCVAGRGQDIFVTNFNSSTIGEYTSSGGTVNPSLISGLSSPIGIAVGQNLFVANQGNGTIGEYTLSGGVVNASLVSGLNSPHGIAVLGSDLFVVNSGNGTVGEYTTSGAVVNATLISGLNNPYDISLSGSNVFVAFPDNGTIGEYTTSGAVVNASLISGLNNVTGIAVSGSNVFVANQGNGKIGEYTTSGGTVNASLISGLNSPTGIAVSGSNVFVTNFNAGTIGEYTTSGAVVHASLISALNSPWGIVVTSAPISGIWTNGAGGNWSVSGNWSGGNVPGLFEPINDTAAFGAASTSGTSVTVTLDTNPQVSAMTFSSTSSYLLQATGANTLTLGATSEVALVTVSAGSQTIAAPLILATSADFAPAAGTQLTISGAISGPGGLALTGAGTLIFSGTNSYTGGTTISAGTLALGNGGTAGSIAGGITNNATLLLNFAGNQHFANSVSGSGSIVVSGPGTVTLQMPLAPTQTVVNQGQLVVPAGVSVSGDLVIGSSGHCTNNGDMSNIGNFTNAGIFGGSAQVSGSFSNAPTGTVRIAPGQSLYLQGASPQSNAGLVQLIGTATAQAQFESAGPLTNAAGGTALITAQNATVNFDSGLTNQGSVAFSYGISNVSGNITNAPGSNITVAGGAGVTFYGDVAQNGTLVVSAVGSTHSSTVFLGAFSGSGGFTGGGDVFFEGDLRPSDPVEVTFGGNAFLEGSTNTVMQLAGPVAGSEYDQITVTGQLALAGDLDIVLLNGFQPQDGESFQLFDGQLSGSFSQLSLPTLSNGHSWDTTNLDTYGTISVVPEPSTLALFGVGAIGLVGYYLRRRTVRTAKSAAFGQMHKLFFYSALGVEQVE
jgi:autotransporter-associated beta strand protein